MSDRTQETSCPACGCKETEIHFDGALAMLHCLGCLSDTAGPSLLGINNAVRRGHENAVYAELFARSLVEHTTGHSCPEDADGNPKMGPPWARALCWECETEVPGDVVQHTTDCVVGKAQAFLDALASVPLSVSAETSSSRSPGTTGVNTLAGGGTHAGTSQDFSLTPRNADTLDAERYRYLRDIAGQVAGDEDGPMVCDGLGDNFEFLRGVEVDGSVDGAMAKWKARGCPTPHASDCAVHNAPALPPGPCDCGATSK